MEYAAEWFCRQYQLTAEDENAYPAQGTHVLLLTEKNQVKDVQQEVPFAEKEKLTPVV